MDSPIHFFGIFMREPGFFEPSPGHRSWLLSFLARVRWHQPNLARCGQSCQMENCGKPELQQAEAAHGEKIVVDVFIYSSNSVVIHQFQLKLLHGWVPKQRQAFIDEIWWNSPRKWMEKWHPVKPLSNGFHFAIDHLILIWYYSDITLSLCWPHSYIQKILLGWSKPAQPAGRLDSQQSMDWETMGNPWEIYGFPMRKPWFLPWNLGGSKCSLDPIHWKKIWRSHG